MSSSTWCNASTFRPRLVVGRMIHEDCTSLRSRASCVEHASRRFIRYCEQTSACLRNTGTTTSQLLFQYNVTEEFATASAGALHPLGSMTLLTSCLFRITVLSISGMAFSTNKPSSSSPFSFLSGRLTLIALHFADVISTSAADAAER